MPYQVYLAQLAFQPTKPGDPTVPVGDEVIVQRGGMVPEWVPTFIVNALQNAGMILPVAEPLPGLVPVGLEPARPVTPDQPIVQPNNPGANPPTLGTLLGTETQDTTGAPVARPIERDSKAKWEAYAVQLGIPQGQAESMNKTALQAEVERVEAAKASGQDPFPPSPDEPQQ